MRRSIFLALALAACGGDKVDDTGGVGTDTGTVPTETFSYGALVLLGDQTTVCSPTCPAHEILLLCGVMTNNTATEQVVEVPTTSLVDAWVVSGSDGSETLMYQTAETPTEFVFAAHEEITRCAPIWEGDVGTYSLEVQWGNGESVSMAFTLQ